MSLQAAVVCYDLPVVSRFFRSVATSVVLQQKTRVEWVRYQDSAVINGIYKVLFWKEPPGWVEVHPADPEKMRRDVNKLHEEYLLSWIGKLCKSGPAEANKSIKRWEEIRNSARDAVREVYRNAGAINEEVRGETQDAIRHLAQIRLSAAVGVAVIGGAAGVAFATSAMSGATAASGMTLFGLQAGGSATAFGATAFGHSVVGSMVKNWESAPTASVVAINADTGQDAGKYIAEEVGGKLAERAATEAMRNSGHAKQIISSANGLIKQHSERLASDVLRKAAMKKSQNILARSTTQVAQQTARVGRAQSVLGAARVAGKGVPIVFAAWDIMDAWSDYQATIR